MSWFRLDDQGAFHAKVVAAGNEAYGAWCRAGQWSCGLLTEGRVPSAVAATIAPARVWKKLLEVGLVEQRPDGWQIHDFLEYNPTAEEEKRKREARAVAGKTGGQRTQEAKRQANDQAIASAVASALLEANGKQNSTPSPSPSPSPDQVCMPAKKSRRSREPRCETGYPSDFAVSSEIEAICRAEGLPNPHEVLPDFRDKSQAKGYRYKDWEAAYRAWMRHPITRERYRPWAETEPELKIHKAPGREKYIPAPDETPPHLELFGGPK